MRSDDIMELINRAEAAHVGKTPGKVKVLQTWQGSVAAETGEPDTLIEALQASKNARWTITDVKSGNGWVAFRAWYTAKGANANDAENLVRRFSPAVTEVAVNTFQIVPA